MGPVDAVLAAQLVGPPQSRSRLLAAGNSYLMGGSLPGSDLQPMLPGLVDNITGRGGVLNLGFSAVASGDVAFGFARMSILLPWGRSAGPDLPLWGGGFTSHHVNDLVYEASGYVWRNWHRYFLAHLRGSRFIPATDAAWSETGTWTTRSPGGTTDGTLTTKPTDSFGTLGGNYARGTMRESTSGTAKRELTVPSDYDGDGRVYLMFPVEPYDNNVYAVEVKRGSTYYPAVISDEPVDGVCNIDARKATYPEWTQTSTSTYHRATNGILCKMVTGANGARIGAGDKIRISVTTLGHRATDQGGTAYAGYAEGIRVNGAILEAGPVPPAALHNFPKVPLWSAQDGHAYPENDTRTDTFNAQPPLLAAEFDDGQVSVVDINAILNPGSGPTLFGDIRHPNARGYALIAADTARKLTRRRSLEDQACLARGFTRSSHGSEVSIGQGNSVIAPGLALGFGLGSYPGGIGSRELPWWEVVDGYVIVGGCFGVSTARAADATILTFPTCCGVLPANSQIFDGFDTLGNFVELRIDAAESVTGLNVPGRLRTITGIAVGAGIDLSKFGITWKAQL